MKWSHRDVILLCLRLFSYLKYFLFDVFLFEQFGAELIAITQSNGFMELFLTFWKFRDADAPQYTHLPIHDNSTKRRTPKGHSSDDWYEAGGKSFS